MLNVLIWFPTVALLLVGALLYRRRVYRELPLFFIYVVSALSIGVLRYVAFRLGRDVYFYVYWTSELAAAVFVSLALYEIFLRRLFPAFHKVRFYRNLFPLAAIAIFLVAVITASESSDKRAAFVTASSHADLARTAILVFFVALMALMGRQWRRYDFGIALGFGVQAAVALADTAISFQYHDKAPAFLTTIDVIVYDITCLIWLITFLRSEKTPPSIPGDRLDTAALNEAKKWESTLKDFLTHRKG